jgi:NADH:ubiquinone oxidoreductase subunit 6 (subunit J)
MAIIIFYIFAAFMVTSGLLILFTKNVLYAAFLLIITFLSVAALYVFMLADFVAVTQVLVYVGGILVLLIFGVMLTNRLSGEPIITENHHIFTGSLIGFSFFALILYVIKMANFTSLEWIITSVKRPSEITSTIGTIGVSLMSNYILPFELIAILLLIALIGAAFIARKQVGP